MDALAEAGGKRKFNLTIRRRPFFLYPGGKHSLSNWGDRVNALYHPSAAQSLTALGASAGYRFDMDAPLSDTLDSHRLVLWAQHIEAGKGEELAQAIGFRYFERAQPLADRTMLCACVEEIGLDGAAARRYLQSDAGVADVQQSVERLGRAGVHSIPVFVFQSGDFSQTVHGSADVATFVQVFRDVEAHFAARTTNSRSEL